MTNQLSHLKKHYKTELEKLREMVKEKPNTTISSLAKTIGFPSNVLSRIVMIIEEEQNGKETARKEGTEPVFVIPDERTKLN